VVFYHYGFAEGPVLLTDESAAVVEERRYEPFGAALDSVNDTGMARLTSGFPDEQPEQDD